MQSHDHSTANKAPDTKAKDTDTENHESHNHHGHMIAEFRQKFWISLVLTLPILVLAPMIQSMLGYELGFKGDRYVQFTFASILFFYGGWPFLKGAFEELKKKAPGMMTLIAMAISVAYIYSSVVVFGLEGKTFFWELASLIDIMLLGHWIEMKSVMGASNALQELVKLIPATANRIEESDTKEVPVADLKVGDLIRVKPGEKLPADGVIKEGESRVNESMITGESVPVSKKPGDQVIGGAINEQGALIVEVKHTGEDAYLSKVIGMVSTAQATKSKSQTLADKAASWLFYFALGAGILTLGTWLAIGKSFDFALERMVTVMIISCPHALGLAIPLVVAISTSASAKKGLLIRNRTAFENVRKIDTLLFDKTGTLTKGKFGVTRILPLSPKYKEEDIIRIAASIEQSSEHPIATAIVMKAKEMDLTLSESSDFENMAGKGVRALVDGQKIAVVSPGYLEENNLEAPPESFKDNFETVVFLLENNSILGVIALSDEIRPESKEAVARLKERGIKVMMATGDNSKVAESVSKALELDAFFAEVLPEGKQKIIQDLQSKGNFVAMTGDGVNDAPAIAQANVGIAIGSGTDVAAETADIILVNNNPLDIVDLIRFGTLTHKKMRQNLYWAVGYNVIAVPLAAGVLAPIGFMLSPAIGAILMSLSTVVVAVNAQLLKTKI